MTRIYLIGRVMIESDLEVIESAAFPVVRGVSPSSTWSRRPAASTGRIWPSSSGRTVCHRHGTPLSPPSSPNCASCSIAPVSTGHQAIESVHGSYEFRPPPGTWIDLRYAINELDHAEGALRRGQAKEAWAGAAAASAILRRSFLTGESGNWLDEIRRNLHDLQIRALDALAGTLLMDGQPTAALTPARKAVDIAPFRESGYARLMECHIAAGNRAEALRVYADLSGLLRDNLGVSPTPDIEALYEQALG